MVMFLLGISVGIIVSMISAMVWGYRLSIKEEELSREMIKDFQDRFLETEEQKIYKRYES
jgi:MFS superfamily sulfate permease-like transporter